MKNTFTRALLAAAITSLPLSPISAANYTWTGPGTNMTTAANWGGTTPTAADTGTFAGATPTNPLVQYTGSPLTFNAAGLIYSFGSGSYSVGVDAANVFNGAVVSIGASGVTNNSGAAQTIGIVNGANFGIVAGSLDSTLSATGGITYSIGSGTDTVRSTLVTQANASLGDASILVNGSSSLTPGNQNFLRIQDATNLQSASLVAGSQGEIFINTTIATSTADVSLSGGSLLIINQPITLNNLISGTSTDSIVLAANVTLNNTTANNIQGVISGAGAFISNSGSVGVNNSSNSYTGGTFVNGGTMTGFTQSIPLASSEPSLVVAAGANFSFENTIAGTFTGDILDNGNVTYNAVSGSEISGDISGTGSFTLATINPTDVFTLSGANTYTGGTDIIQGILQVNPGSLPVSSADPSPASVAMSNASRLRFIGAAPNTYSGAISGTGSVQVGSTSDVTLTSLNNTYTTGTVVDGTLHVTAANLPTNGTVDVPSVTSLLDFTSTTTETFGGVIAGLGQVQLSGTGQLTLSGNNSYTGGTFVEAGTLIGSTTSIPVAATQPSITIDNAATFQFNQTGSGSFAGDIVISTANGILQSNGPGNLEIIGQITGNGKLLVSEGELTLTRPSIGPNNTYSGGSEIINGSTLIGDTNSLQGVVSINDGNLTFVQTTDGTFNGTFTGFSGDNVNKTGTGTLNLAFPTPMFFGQTNVQQGTLNLVSTYLGGDVEVNSGTFLTGIGQIGGNLAVLGGTVSPGNSIGTILVSGNYTQNATGIYEVEINGAGQSDLIVVEDSAVLAGTVSVISLDGVINPANNYVIMHVDGSITGEFQNVVTESPSIVAAVYYIDDTVNGGVNVILKIETLFSSLAYTSNEIQVANQLNSITNPTPELQAMLDALTLLGTTDPEAATLALDQMTGQQYTNLVVAAEISTHQFIRRLYDPLRSIVTTYPCNCYDSCCEPCPTLDLWIEGGGGRTFIEGTTNTRGFHTDGYEVTGGVQSTFKRDWTVGLAGSYVKDTVSYNVGGSGKNQTGYAGIYGLYRPANFYVLADGVFGYTENKVRRFISIGDLAYTSNSKPTTYQGSGYIEAGIDCPWNCMLLQPFLGFEASYYNRKGFTETGANPLNLVVSKKSHTNVFSRLGAHLTTNQLPYNLSLSVDLAWQYRITSLGNSINERFQSFGDNFTIKGLHFRRSSVDAAATITAVVFDNWQLYLEASGERWSRASTYNFLGGVKFSW